MGIPGLARYESGIFPVSVPESLVQCLLLVDELLYGRRQHEKALKPISSGVLVGLE